MKTEWAVFAPLTSTHLAPRKAADLTSVTPLSIQAGKTALIWAAARGHTECVDLLVNAGADVFVETNVRGLVNAGSAYE